jgi:hypothetical protein
MLEGREHRCPWATVLVYVDVVCVPFPPESPSSWGFVLRQVSRRTGSSVSLAAAFALGFSWLPTLCVSAMPVLHCTLDAVCGVAHRWRAQLGDGSLLSADDGFLSVESPYP